MKWLVYILKCSDNSYYTGITNDLKRRIFEHNNSNTVGSKYVRARRPVNVVYRIQVETRSEALKKESEIKRLSREKKQMLISSVP